MKTEEIVTRVARATVGEHHFCGRRVFAELEGRATLAHLCMLAITGRLPTDAEARLLDDLAVVSTAGDPRVWPLKIARFGASHGDVFAGLAAGPLIFGSARIGPRIGGLAAAALERTRARAGELGSTEAAIAEVWLEPGVRLPGFGVPFRATDERLEALVRRVRAAGRDALPYWTLSERVAAAVVAGRGVQPNTALGTAAALLDLGLSAPAVTPMVAMLLQPLTLANAWEGAREPSPSARRIDPADVRYAGPPPRRSSGR